ncbi:MAG: energy-coupling factor transporter transmembrane component T [Candidatus Aureabacteria bacterium]|nr:energy-coupling factor transporter transmembrane component T [Candidatus Auribacterota bacterium]
MTRSFHPVAALLTAAMIFSLAMSWTNPLWSVALLACIALPLCPPDSRGALRGGIRSIAPLALLCGIANMLFSREGHTVLVSVAGHPFTLEAMIYGLGAGLRIALAVAVWYLLAGLIDRDDALRLFSRCAPTSSMVASLATLLIPRMRRDLVRIRMAMGLRGAPLDAPGFAGRIRAQRPLMHAMLLSSLEGAWDIAIALHCRGFGAAARTFPVMRPWTRRDSILSAGAVAAAAIAFIARHAGAGVYRFYPVLDPFIRRADLLFLAAALAALVAGFSLARRADR